MNKFKAWVFIDIMKNSFLFILIISSACSSCTQNKKTKTLFIDNSIVTDTFKIFTKPSTLKNQYVGFNSPNAINKIAEIENEYFNNYLLKESTYYGTQWYNLAINTFNANDTISVFQKYKLDIKEKDIDSMHCTIYAIKALESGFGPEFNKIKKHHIDIWSEREYAGWSIAYILTEFYNWKAYLIISEDSNEYSACINNYKKDKKYHVWKQPNIKLENIFNTYKDKVKIDSLLNVNEFGWGFSNQGWHTWITRYNNLKECNWLGSPAKKYNQEGNKPLFITTKFANYSDYNSHIVVFPPKNKKK